MGSRYIEIFQATSAEMLLAIANSPSPSQNHRRSSQPYQQAPSGQHFAQGLPSHYAQQPYLPPGPQSVGMGSIGSSGINLANQATAATMGAGLQSMIGFGTSNTMGVGAPLGLGNMGISGLDPALGTLLQLTALAQQSLPTTGAPLSQLDMMMNPAAAASYSMGGSSVAPSSWTSSPAAALSSLNTLYGTMAAHLSTPLASTAAAGGAGSTTGVWPRPQQGATTAAATGYAPSAQGLPSSTYPSYTISSPGGYGSVPQQTSYPITSSASYAAYQPPVSATGAASSAATSYSSSRPYQSQRDQSEPQITSGMTLRMRGEYKDLYNNKDCSIHGCLLILVLQGFHFGAKCLISQNSLEGMMWCRALYMYVPKPAHINHMTKTKKFSTRACVDCKSSKRLVGTPVGR